MYSLSIPLALQHVPERDVPDTDVSLRGTMIKIGPQMERDVRDRIKRHLKKVRWESAIVVGMKIPFCQRESKNPISL